MSTDKSGRKKLAKALFITITILIVAFILEINVTDVIPNQGSNTDIVATAPIQNSSQTTKVEGNLVLTMIDVGQADSFLFEQNGKIALIDCGTRSTGKDVVDYLKKQQITKIDYVFGTHPHDDHMGGMYDIITNFEIGKIIIPEIETGEVTTNWYMKLMQEITNGEYQVETAKIGTVYQLGSASLKVIGPISKLEGNLNNYSTVLKVSFGEMDIIMTGDAEKEVEREILATGENIEAEILKMGHHGSDTSSSTEFLDAINPDYALISAKIGNKYKHPIKSTMEELEGRNIQVYRTDENGTVIATITSSTVNFSCEPGDYLSGVELEERSQK